MAEKARLYVVMAQWLVPPPGKTVPDPFEIVKVLKPGCTRKDAERYMEIASELQAGAIHRIDVYVLEDEGYPDGQPKALPLGHEFVPDWSAPWEDECKAMVLIKGTVDLCMKPRADHKAADPKMEPPREFYELCQEYRCAPLPDQGLVRQRYLALWAYVVESAHLDQTSPDAPQPVGLRDEPDASPVRERPEGVSPKREA